VFKITKTKMKKATQKNFCFSKKLYATQTEARYKKHFGVMYVSRPPSHEGCIPQFPSSTRFSSFCFLLVSFPFFANASPNLKTQIPAVLFLYGTIDIPKRRKKGRNSKFNNTSLNIGIKENRPMQDNLNRGEKEDKLR